MPQVPQEPGQQDGWASHRRHELPKEFIQAVILKNEGTQLLVMDEATEFSDIRDINPDVIVFPDGAVAAYRAGEMSITDVLGGYLNWNEFALPDKKHCTVVVVYNQEKRSLQADLDTIQKERYKIDVVLIDLVAVPEEAPLWTPLLYHPVEWASKKHRSGAEFVAETIDYRVYKPGKSFSSWQKGKKSPVPSTGWGRLWRSRIRGRP